MSGSQATPAADLLGTIVAAARRITAVRSEREPIGELAKRAEKRTPRPGAFMGGIERAAVAALALPDASVLPWAPILTNDGNLPGVRVAMSGDQVYMAGDFVSLGGQGRHSLGATDLVAGSPSPWNPQHTADGTR